MENAIGEEHSLQRRSEAAASQSVMQSVAERVDAVMEQSAEIQETINTNAGALLDDLVVGKRAMTPRKKQAKKQRTPHGEKQLTPAEEAVKQKNTYHGRADGEKNPITMSELKMRPDVNVFLMANIWTTERKQKCALLIGAPFNSWYAVYSGRVRSSSGNVCVDLER